MQISTPPSTASQSFASVGLTVLICCDYLEKIRNFVEQLRSAGYKLVFCTNAKNVSARVMALQPGLVLMSFQTMHVGYAACRVLKGHQETRDIPVIFLSRSDCTQERLMALRAGAADCVAQGVSAEEVVLRVGIHSKQLDTHDVQKTHFCASEYSQATASIVQACIGLLESDLSCSPSTQDLAAKLGTTRQQLTSAFKEVFGCPVYGWMRKRRIDQACEWLLRCDVSIQSIAEDLGYSSSANFTTAFRARMGMTPRAFRRISRAAGAQMRFEVNTRTTQTQDSLAVAWRGDSFRASSIFLAGQRGIS